MNKSKNIGTAAESACVTYARAHGYPLAERLALAGSQDLGDVRLTAFVHLEVKGGHAAEAASDAQIEAWMLELERELGHAGAIAGALITKRRGYGAQRAEHWWAHVRASWLATWRCYPETHTYPVQPEATVRMTYADLLVQLRAAGYGTPLDAQEAR